MRVAVVGAGVAGLAAARMLAETGFDVVVFEEQDEVGGVWTRSRRYPGLRTQNDHRTYAFSDLRMPDADREPTAATVQAYLQEYARGHGLDRRIQLSTRVVRASWIGHSWELEVQHAGEIRQEEADWFVAANGLHTRPHVPVLAGADEFLASGGDIVPPSRLGDGSSLRDRNVLVVGYGKSAADVAVAALPHARAVAVVARRPLWKLPPSVGPLTFERLVLSRAGEHLLWAPYRTAAGRLGRRVGRPLRARLVARLGRRIVRDLQLAPSGLAPSGSLDTVTHLTTPGFFEAVLSGRIVVRTGASVAALRSTAAGGGALLTDGTVVPAEVIVAATGFELDLAFLDEAVQARLVDDDGAMRLYLHTLPERQPALAFVGWTHSFRSPLSAEVQAVWLAALLRGCVRLPPPAIRVERTTAYRPDRAAAERGGLPQVSKGVSIPDLDRWLAEAGGRLAFRTLVRQLFRPVDPAEYAAVIDATLDRLRAASVSEPRAGATASP